VKRAEPRPSRHPFRDTVIMYAVLAIVIVVVAKFTNGDVGRAIFGAAAFFVVATAWSWWRFRRRVEQERGG
jgi:membrane protein implicated in regulation of membrane protease activity